MPAPEPILSLIERFEFHRQAYILGNYNETQLLREFVDKFFSALSWDVDNNRDYLKDFPLITINPNDPDDIARHDRMVTHVTQMLNLNKKLQDVRLEQEKTMLSRQIGATDGAIDKLVYELYGLTWEEISVVEGSAK